VKIVKIIKPIIKEWVKDQGRKVKDTQKLNKIPHSKDKAHNRLSRKELKIKESNVNESVYIPKQANQNPIAQNLHGVKRWRK